jgi:SagB-type dehydrogenase family enzyme
MVTDRELNRETAAARHFHAVTKYVRPSDTSPASIMMGEAPNLGPAIGEQNPAIEPFPYKIYTDLAPIPLPRDFPERDLPALEALAASGDVPAGTAIPDLEAVARLCLRSNGLLKRWRSLAGREIEFRAAGCTGARYHLELYLVSGDLPGLAAGVYHYAAHDHSLRQLRGGDYRAEVVEATGQEPAIASAPVVAIWTSTFWRNAWRYQARAYRHVYWDTATVLANQLAVAAEEALPAKVVLGFADAEINALLDVDGQREAAVCLVALGRTSRESEVGSREGQSDLRPPTSDLRPAITPLGFATHPISAREIDFPDIGAMHDASSLATGAEALAWRSGAFRPEESAPTGPLIPLAPLDPASLPSEPIDEVIARRRSNRHYLAETPLSFAALSTVIAAALHEPAMDCLLPPEPPSTRGGSLHGAAPLYTPYLIVNNVEGLQPGAYVVHPQAMALELLKPDDSRSAGSSLACFQDYADAAHVNAYTLTDLEPVLAHFGNRGYRLAQLEASLFGAKLQLAAHALGLGAVGSTSYDDDVTAYFSPHAAGKSFMFIAVFGHKRRPSTDEVAAKSGFLQPSVTGDR